MAELTELRNALSSHGLAAVGGFHTHADDKLPEDVATLILIGADGDRFWPVFEASPEARDGARDPIDRWSRRVLSGIADALGARALFPFGGPPYQPFMNWAQRGERTRPSPVRIHVSPHRGLSASYRGALGFSMPIALPMVARHDPCIACHAPCLTACPVGALGDGPYDVGRCVAHLASADGAPCRDGCLVRLACPVGEPPPLDQRRYHMAAFLTSQGH